MYNWPSTECLAPGGAPQLAWGQSSTDAAIRGEVVARAFVLQTSAVHVLDQYHMVPLCKEKLCSKGLLQAC